MQRYRFMRATPIIAALLADGNDCAPEHLLAA